MVPWTETAFEIFVLVALFIAWAGTIIPMFPAPAVVWALTLLYGIVDGFELRGIIFFAIITILAIVATFTDEVLTIAGARKGGARWMSITISSIVGLVTSILFTPIVGILMTIASLYLAENYYQQDAAKAWESTKRMIFGWGWATVAKLGIGLVQILLWAAWAWL